MVREVFRPESEITLFLRIRTKEIVEIQRKCILTEKLFPLLQEMGVAEANGEVRFLTGSS